jgi:protein involved in polysaccharide export with SLBB domain
VEGALGGPSVTSGAAAYYYISKSGEITMPLNLWGMVKNPGRYEVPISTDLVQLISFAGGPLGDADLSSVKITRIERRDESFRKVEFKLDLRNLDKLDSQALSLRPGDTIFIDTVAFHPTDILSYLTTTAVLVTAIASVISVMR